MTANIPWNGQEPHMAEKHTIDGNNADPKEIYCA